MSINQDQQVGDRLPPTLLDPPPLAMADRDPGMPRALRVAQVPLEQIRSELLRGRHLSETIERPGATLELFEAPDRQLPAVALRTSAGYTEAHARCLYLTLAACQQHATSHGLQRFAPQPWSWGGDPPYVSVEWVPGTGLGVLYQAEVERVGSAEAIDLAVHLAHQLGALLASFHTANADLVASHTDLPAKSDALVHASWTHRVATRLAGGTSSAPERKVRSFDDPGPHNVIVDADGRLVLIDLPSEVEVVELEHDLGRAVATLSSMVGRRSRTGLWPGAVRYEELADAMADGYEAAAPQGSTSVDRELVLALLAATAAKRALLTRRRQERGHRIYLFVRELLAAAHLARRVVSRRVRRPRR